MFITLILLVNACENKIDKSKEFTETIPRQKKAGEIYSEIIKNYSEINTYNAKGTIQKVTFILPGNGVKALGTVHQVNFQLTYDKSKNVELLWSKYPEMKNKRLSLPAIFINKPEEYLYQESLSIIKNTNFSKERLSTNGKLRVENKDLTLEPNKFRDLNYEIEDLSDAFINLESETSVDYIIPTFLEQKLSDFLLYKDLNNLSVIGTENVDDVNCYILKGSRLIKENEGMIVKIWVGKKDSLIRKIEKYNFFEKSIVLNIENHEISKVVR